MATKIRPILGISTTKPGGTMAAGRTRALALIGINKYSIGRMKNRGGHLPNRPTV